MYEDGKYIIKCRSGRRNIARDINEYIKGKEYKATLNNDNWIIINELNEIDKYGDLVSLFGKRLSNFYEQFEIVKSIDE